MEGMVGFDEHLGAHWEPLGSNTGLSPATSPKSQVEDVDNSAMLITLYSSIEHLQLCSQVKGIC